MSQPLISSPAAPKSTTLRTQAQLIRRLLRLELSAMIALSTLAGYLFAGGTRPLSALLVTVGAGLLAGGCSALNQVQEQDLDSRMQRTRNRPLPTSAMDPAGALLLVALLFSGGALALLSLFDTRPLLLGMLAVIWYNAIYTPLKRRTAFAAVPGAVCGALPPLIGWSAAGAPLLSQPALILAATLFIWQIPHTWLLLCRHRDDLRRSGLPDLFETITTTRLLSISHCWSAALLVCYLLFPLFAYIRSPGLSMVFIFSLGIIAYALVRAFVRNFAETAARRGFHLINLSMALFLTILICDRLFF